MMQSTMLLKVNQHRRAKARGIHVKHSPSGVTDPEATRLDTTDSGGTGDQDVLGFGEVHNLLGVPISDILRSRGGGPDLGCCMIPRVNG